MSISSHGSGTVFNKKMDKDFSNMQTDFLLLKEHESKRSEMERKKILSTLVESKLPQHLITRYGKERGSVRTAIEMRPSNSIEENRVSNKSTPVARFERGSGGANVKSKLNCEIRTIVETEENHNLSGSYLIFGKEKVDARFRKMDNKFLDFHLNQSNLMRGFGQMKDQFGMIQGNGSLKGSQIEFAKHAFQKKVKGKQI